MQHDPLDSCFAITAPGLEAVAARELAGLGAAAETLQTTPGGVNFAGDVQLLYRANLHMRTASRIVVRAAKFRARTFHELERYAGKIEWERYATRGSNVALRVTSKKSKLYHEGAIGERLMQAIAARIPGAVFVRPGSDDDDADAAGSQLFVVRFMRDECVVSADASGALLHRRGYRQAVAKAPLRETLAAAMLLATGWDGSAPLLDPMCGSGTIPIEAALLARGIAPGLANPELRPRRFAFAKWQNFDAVVWSDVVARAQSQVLPAAAVSIRGSDRDAGAIRAALSNAERAGVAADVHFDQAALSAATVAANDAWLVTNPPYGVRIGGGDVRDLYAALGHLVKERAPSGRTVLLTPEPQAARWSGLPLEPVTDVSNGGIRARIVATPL
jgi:putative N6-adenine-specific DNA methylase